MGIDKDNSQDVATLQAIQATQAIPPTTQDLLFMILTEARKTNFILAQAFNIEISDIDLTNL